MQPDTDVETQATVDTDAAVELDAASTESSVDTDIDVEIAVGTEVEAQVTVDTDRGPGDDGTYVPPMLYCVFGLPILLTLVWFFLRFTRPDRFGRVDRDALGDPPTDPGQDRDSEGDLADETDDDALDEDEDLPPAG